MKKSIVGLLLVIMLSSSCSTYYCATYAKAPKKEIKKGEESQSERI